MFCKKKISRYFVTFINDNKVTKIFNMDGICELLCKVLFSDKLDKLITIIVLIECV